MLHFKRLSNESFYLYSPMGGLELHNSYVISVSSLCFTADLLANLTWMSYAKVVWNTEDWGWRAFSFFCCLLSFSLPLDLLLKKLTVFYQVNLLLNPWHNWMKKQYLWVFVMWCVVFMLIMWQNYFLQDKLNSTLTALQMENNRVKQCALTSREGHHH